MPIKCRARMPFFLRACGDTQSDVGCQHYDVTYMHIHNRLLYLCLTQKHVYEIGSNSPEPYVVSGGGEAKVGGSIRSCLTTSELIHTGLLRCWTYAAATARKCGIQGQCPSTGAEAEDVERLVQRSPSIFRPSFVRMRHQAQRRTIMP